MKSSSEKTARELALDFAKVRNYEGRDGGWIYNPAGKPVVQGWDSFAKWLIRKGWITPGVGIDWLKSDPQRLAEERRQAVARITQRRDAGR